MQYVKWIPEKYSVHIQKIDDQHQVLLDIINEVYDANLNNSKKAVIANILSKLIDYTKTHFSAEESLMAEYGFSGLEQHQVFHKFFIQKINQFVKEFNAKEELLSDEILYFLKDWLINHIMTIDKMYATDLNSKGIF